MTTKTLKVREDIKVTKPVSKSLAKLNKKEKTIFITYNPDNELERTIAARLHTIGSVSDNFKMYLPDRFNSETILDDETKRRIEKSDYIILFSMGNLSKIVKQELDHAFNYFNDKSKIIIIHDKHQEKPLSISHDKFTVVEFDYINDSHDEFVTRVIDAIEPAEKTKKNKQTTSQVDDRVVLFTALTAIIIIGLGLLLLSLLKKDE